MSKGPGNSEAKVEARCYKAKNFGPAFGLEATLASRT